MCRRERGGLHAACDEQHPVLDDIDDPAMPIASDEVISA